MSMQVDLQEFDPFQKANDATVSFDTISAVQGQLFEPDDTTLLLQIDATIDDQRKLESSITAIHAQIRALGQHKLDLINKFEEYRKTHPLGS